MEITSSPRENAASALTEPDAEARRSPGARLRISLAGGIAWQPAAQHRLAEVRRQIVHQHHVVHLAADALSLPAAPNLAEADPQVHPNGPLVIAEHAQHDVVQAQRIEGIV